MAYPEFRGRLTLSKVTGDDSNASRNIALWSRTMTAWNTWARFEYCLLTTPETIQTRVRSILCEDFEVVGTVGNGRDAVTEVGRLARRPGD